MNKLVLNIGLLSFFLAIIYFSQRGLAIEDIVIRSFAVFVIITILLGILALLFLKAINKTSQKKSNNLANIGRK
jgi:ABC-type amino acid transport system permease subunit